MQSNINIKINGLSEDVSLKIIDSIKDILQNFSFLDFRRFHNIIISSNFNRDIERITFSNETTFKSNYKYNKNTFAEVLTVPKDNDFELFLIIKSNFISNITKRRDNQDYKNALHVLHHELAHIHDNNKKIDVFKDLMKTQKYLGKTSITYPISEVCWSEYIANFISSQSAMETQYPKMVAKTLVDKINKAKIDINTQIEVYKINKSREDLIEDSFSQIKSILKTASYLLGYLNGMKITLAELDDEIDYQIERSYFKEFWDLLKFEIASIHQVYPYGFINLSIYKNLSFVIESFFNKMGIILNEDEKGRVQIHLL